ncbi:MAG: C25 family cysteine peptidase, partial [Caldilineaceae bacterium]
VSASEQLAPATITSELVSVAWAGEVPSEPDLEPPVLDWEHMTRPAAKQERRFPEQPVYLVRSGHMRGEYVAVYAFSEIFQVASGELRRVVAMDVTLPGASLLSELSHAWQNSAQGAMGGLSIAGADADKGALSPNEIASRQSAKVMVEDGGIQEIRADTLAEAGIASPRTQYLQVYLRDVEIPLQIEDQNGDGVLNGEDTFRFYAGEPGDRWNSADIYWIIVGTSPGQRMGSRSVSPGDAPMRTTAVASGTWREYHTYESALPGPDGDHWFHAELAIPVTEESKAAITSVTFELSPDLPLVSDADIESTFVVAGTAVDARDSLAAPAQVPHILQLSGGSVATTEEADDWIVDFATDFAVDFERTMTTTGTADELTIRLLQGPQTTRLYLDTVDWRQPVRLNFAGDGATFEGVAGHWRYRLANVPTGALLYDVTNVRQPIILGRTQGQEYVFEDGPEAKRYVLAATGTLRHPFVKAHTPVSISRLNGADVLYIAPVIFHTALDPLVQARERAGLKVEIVDVQELYDGWGYGFVDPDAIRDFLRWAVSTWNLPPFAVVLVGDGTHDPKGFLGFDNPNHIPPYLADVDPWIGETPCESCYAQLDGDQPLEESAFLIDVLIGRLPVNTITELEVVVSKILGYENERNPVSPWRNLSVQLADDWIHEDGKKDGAGNFTEFVERIFRLRPEGIRYARMYYNPEVDMSLLDQETQDWLSSIKQWIVSSKDAARSRTLSLLDSGAGLVTFTGHANHWMWGRLGEEPGYEPRLFGLWDVSKLTNQNQLFVGLSMTCLSSAFSEPAEYPMTIDEHLLLHPNGGAVAVWGPAGLSVAYGHDALQMGFYSRLWSRTSHAPPVVIGELVRSGYENVVLNSSCCQDVARTFVLLGDPLTPVRVQPLDLQYLPSFRATRQDWRLYIPSTR